MKIKDVIAWVDEVKPNAFSQKIKIQWLSRLEGTLALEVFLMGETEAEQLCYTEADTEAELLVSPPYDDLYPLWLEAKIDQANGEYNKYQNTMQFYNARRGEFVCWFAQTWDPAQGYHSRGRDCGSGYYITAYGLARKRGFQGTLDEWLASLVGPRGPQGSGLVFRGGYKTEKALREAHPTGALGDCYRVGTEANYLAYYWDPEQEDWDKIQVVGPQGPAGPKGDAGDTGPQGPAGPKGDAGDTGETGPAGKDFTIKGYFPTLTALESAVSAPKEGDSYGVGVAAPYDIYTWDAVHGVWVNNGTIQGPPGPQGPQGDAGPQGPVGPKGDTGDVGAQGPKGDTGEAGPQGKGFVIKGYYPSLDALESAALSPEEGDSYGVGGAAPYDIYTWDAVHEAWINNGTIQGPPGPKGDPGPAFTYDDFTPEQLEALRGPKGDTGDTGIQGPAGPKGDTGEAGAQGPAGSKGDRGDQGPKGDKGNPFTYADFTQEQLEALRGPQGIQGPKGATGATGPQGPAGPGMPSGVIVMWSGASSNIPSGWVLCNGSNGTPDLRNRFIVGAGSTYSVGATGGSDTVTLTVDQMPSHSHGYGTNNTIAAAMSGNEVKRILQDPLGYSTNPAGGDQAHENRPPYYALCFIMKQ